MQYCFLFLVAALTTTVGAITGMGGGVIIKPMLDATTELDAMTVSILSSATVFTIWEGQAFTPQALQFMTTSEHLMATHCFRLLMGPCSST